MTTLQQLVVPFRKVCNFPNVQKETFHMQEMYAKKILNPKQTKKKTTPRFSAEDKQLHWLWWFSSKEILNCANACTLEPQNRIRNERIN